MTKLSGRTGSEVKLLLLHSIFLSEAGNDGKDISIFRKHPKELRLGGNAGIELN
jgi:hypothetical protein